jgi:hypothetical protein
MPALINPAAAEHRRENPVSDPIGAAARAAAQRLEAEGRPGLVAEVEAVLAARDPATPPSQYVDPVALASLIVTIASSAWTVYTDLRKRSARPVPAVLARSVRVKLRDGGHTAPDELVEVVVTETVQAAADQDDAGD